MSRAYIGDASRAAGAAVVGLLGVNVPEPARADPATPWQGAMQNELSANPPATAALPAPIGQPIGRTFDCYLGASVRHVDKNEYGPPVDRIIGGGAAAGCRDFISLALPLGQNLQIGGRLQYLKEGEFHYDAVGPVGEVAEDVGHRLYVEGVLRLDDMLTFKLGGVNFGVSPEVSVGTGALGAAIFGRGVVAPVDGPNPWVSGGSYNHTNMISTTLGGCLDAKEWNTELCIRYRAERYDNHMAVGRYGYTGNDHVHGPEAELRYNFGVDESLDSRVAKAREELGGR